MRLVAKAWIGTRAVHKRRYPISVNERNEHTPVSLSELMCLPALPLLRANAGRQTRSDWRQAGIRMITTWAYQLHRYTVPVDLCE